MSRGPGGCGPRWRLRAGLNPIPVRWAPRSNNVGELVTRWWCAVAACSSTRRGTGPARSADGSPRSPSCSPTSDRAESLPAPRQCNDNPYSEAHVKTLKYRPGFPSRFGSIEDARAFCADFFTWSRCTATAGSACSPRPMSMPAEPARSPRPGRSPSTLPTSPIPSASSAGRPRRPRSRRPSGSIYPRRRWRHLSNAHPRVSHGA